MKIFSLTKIEKLKLIGTCIKAATGIAGGSLVLSEGHPYLTIAILAIGAVASEVVSFIKEKENAQNLEDAKAAPAENI
jgi:hypothetical protein